MIYIIMALTHLTSEENNMRLKMKEKYGSFFVMEVIFRKGEEKDDTTAVF